MFALNRILLHVVILVGLLITAASQEGHTFENPNGERASTAPTWAVIHYSRAAGDYGDHTGGNYQDFWGLHVWGDVAQTTPWTSPLPFVGEDEYGRFTWVELNPGAISVSFLVHKGDVIDGGPGDRSFDPRVNPEIWLRQGDAQVYMNQAAAAAFATVRYHRPGGDYGNPASSDFNDYWGLHLWGDGIDPSEATGWTSPKKPTGFDDFGAYWNILLGSIDLPIFFIAHRGDVIDMGDLDFIPRRDPTVWTHSGDSTVYFQRGAIELIVTFHYHRLAGDYGNPSSPNYEDFWGLHVWGDTTSPTSWTQPLPPVGFDHFGAIFHIPLLGGASQVDYILHRGDVLDPGSDQKVIISRDGYEVWQIQAAPVDTPFILPIWNTCVFCDGFESGDTSAWSATQ